MSELKFSHTMCDGFANAILGSRNPFKSWAKSDSYFGICNKEEDYWMRLNKVADTYQETTNYDRINWLNKNCVLQEAQDSEDVMVAMLGKNDLQLAQNLLRSGLGSDSKYLRMIHVQTFIEDAPLFWVLELATYKVGTVMNSSSTMHTGARRDWTLDDFTVDNITTYPSDENNIPIDLKKDMQEVIDKVNKYRILYKNTKDIKYFRAMKEIMPAGMNYSFTFDCNYAVLRTIFRDRKNHRLSEWREDFCDWIKSLPYAEDLITYGID